MQAIEFNATPHSGMLLIPEIYRQEKINAAPDLSEHHDAYVLGQTEAHNYATF